jgi:transposase
MSEIQIQSINQLCFVMGIVPELEIMNQIDTMLPSKSEDIKVSCGTSVIAMILSSLGYANKQLYLTPRFFEKKATEHLLGEGITPEILNHDTLGCTLCILRK